MHPFSRIATVFLIFLSFVFVASAQHTGASDLSLRDESCGERVHQSLLNLETHVSTVAPLLAACTTVAEVQAQVTVLVGHVEACAAAIVAVGKKIDIDASVKAEICAKVVAIISVILHACLEVSLKLGLKVLLAIFLQLDVCIKLLLVNLGICIEGAVELCAKLIVTLCADIFVTLDFKACIGLLALVN